MRQIPSPCLCVSVVNLQDWSFQFLKSKYFSVIPKSKGLTRCDPDLIPNRVGIKSDGFRDLFGIDPGILSGSIRDCSLAYDLASDGTSNVKKSKCPSVPINAHRFPSHSLGCAIAGPGNALTFPEIPTRSLQISLCWSYGFALVSNSNLELHTP